MGFFAFFRLLALEGLFFVWSGSPLEDPLPGDPEPPPNPDRVHQPPG